MTIGVALLGITHPHTSGRAEVFAELPDVKLLAVYDKDPVVEPLSRYTGLPIRSPSDILSDRAVDIILVHSQTEEMVDYCVAALDAGKSVLVEKPCGTGPEDLNRLVEAQERSASVLQAGFNFRFSPVVEAMKEIVDGGVLGEITQVRAHGGCALGEHKTPMLNRPRDIGGAFFVIGCHIVDILLHLFGAPDQISATVAKFPKSVGRDVAGGRCRRVPSLREQAGIGRLYGPGSAWERRKLGFLLQWDRRRPVRQSPAGSFQAVSQTATRQVCGRMVIMVGESIPDAVVRPADRFFA
jgi:predicted dehydrogenase